MDEIVAIGCAMPDASTDERQYLSRRVLIDGRVVVVRYVRLAWVHASAQLRRLASGCCVDGRIDPRLVAHFIEGAPLDRLTHTVYFWVEVGAAPHPPRCDRCHDGAAAPPEATPAQGRAPRRPLRALRPLRIRLAPRRE